MNHAILYDTLFKCLVNQDEVFTRLAGQGVFYAPELYLATEMGKAMKQNEKAIFTHDAQWLRETNYGNGGPSDFAFIVGDIVHVFELKLRNTVYSYKRDIEKLKQLSAPKYKKYFIALVDEFTNKSKTDGRIEALEKDFPEIKRITEFKSFVTKQDWYSSGIKCTVCIWEVF